MALVLSITGVAFAAFCVWLTVRIISRRERWAKWTLAAAVALPILYVASFGPVCWLSDWDVLSREATKFVYRPLVKLSLDAKVPDPLMWYGSLAGLPPLPVTPYEDGGTDCRLCMAYEIKRDILDEQLPWRFNYLVD